MRICIFGAGAVGGNFAARLARAGTDVTMIARGPHLAAIQERGLTVMAGEERIHVRPSRPTIRAAPDRRKPSS